MTEKVQGCETYNILSTAHKVSKPCQYFTVCNGADCKLRAAQPAKKILSRDVNEVQDLIQDHLEAGLVSQRIQ